MAPLNRKGRVPKKLKISHMPVTIMYPSLFPYTFSSFLKGENTTMPVTIVIIAEYINEDVAGS